MTENEKAPQQCRSAVYTVLYDLSSRMKSVKSGPKRIWIGSPPLMAVPIYLNG